MTDLLYVYVVMAGVDGSISIDTNTPEDLDVVRAATLSDIADSTRKVSADIERDLVVSSVVNRITDLLPKEESKPSVASRVTAKLAERKLVESVPEAETDDPE